jgi:transglutaminase-like putative cysteine protease
MLLSVLHESVYQYSPAVDLAQHVAHLKPRETPFQKVLNSSIDILPAPASHAEQLDAFGNVRNYLTLEGRHETLRISAASLVRTGLAQAAAPAPDATAPWEEVREHFRYRVGAPFDAAVEFSFASPHVRGHASFAKFAQQAFTPGRPVLEASIALMRNIHRQLRYSSKSTDVHTPAHEALEQGVGVCQDFAHIFLSCLRQLGLAARYVSGYLLTLPPAGQQRLVGADASHAWVAVWIPTLERPGEGVWVDLDPTNDRWGPGAPGEDYITLAWGRDFSDVSPVRGVIRGGASHELEVAVTVEPVKDGDGLKQPV